MIAIIYTDYDQFETDGKPGSIYFAEDNGPERIWIHHHCPKCGGRSGLRLFGPNHPFWTMTQRNPITLEPSIYHADGKCEYHGYLKNGEWTGVISPG